jgi:hypothetical protein
MTACQTRAARRGGTTLVESALLLSIFLLFLLGVLEYSRYLLMLHVVTNAARDGGRYAAVNVSMPDNFDFADATVASTTYPSVWKYTLGKMAGVDRMVQNITINTFPCDSVALYGNSGNGYTPVISPKSGYVGPTATDYNNGAQTSSYSITRTTDWNEASFSERIGVRVTGTYQPVLPSFLFMSGTASVNITVVVNSEG